ncbi:MAG TPA: 2-oxoacid:acceptor oxidoreductase family protein [Clostridiales bacterium]|jgi:2-oxoglutarate ferredoxin oxidoreductase subunit gamma|nr:2-oxoacid:acceptor oxidoreductase family protein [Clostridiales bacterium]HPP68735.1 2-oxoacid:acceptor oxidoreductase family protein [Clostridiales bacterium]
MKQSILISGSGGQGVLSAGMLLAQSAADSGKYASFLPEYGPEQRGGSAKCTVLTSDKEIISPLPKKCMYWICMNEQSFKKFGTQLKEGGVLVYNSNRVTSPITRTDITAIPVPSDQLADQLGNPKAANIILIGALLAARKAIVDPEHFLKSLEEKFASKSDEIRELNAKAFKIGGDIGKDYAE